MYSNEKIISIFVSQRIDVPSELINTSLYKHVLCGAMYDNNNKRQILGDNTGINISNRSNLYGELTVQYWAWKNCAADYYGLCHYRRYLSFSEKDLTLDHFNMSRETAITQNTLNKHMLLDEEKIRNIVVKNDIIFLKGSDCKEMLVKGGHPKNVRELWEAHDNIFIDKKYLDVLLKKIKNLKPEYYQSALNYFNSDIHFGFNCFVMKKDLFNKLCEFQFPILFDLEPQIISENYSGMMVRLPGYLGEILYGIFVYHLVNIEKVNYKEVPVVFFLTTTKVKNVFDYILRWLKEGGKSFVGEKTLKILPRGSRRRLFFKNISSKIK